MSLRSILLSLSFLGLGAFFTACVPSKNPEDIAKANAIEAQTLYVRANDSVNSLQEGKFSYAFIQFHWKRAQANLDRILRAYPDTPTAKKLAAGELKIGPFETEYFKKRVLPYLEVKKLAAFDAVNCAIFLYNTRETSDPVRLAAMESIIEVMSRQQRWAEVMDFPVLKEHQPLKLMTTFRVATRFDAAKFVKELLENTTDKEKALLYPIQAESLAIRGSKLEDLMTFAEKYPSTEVRLAILSGMVEREIAISHAPILKIDVKDVFVAKGKIDSPETRYDVHVAAAALFKDGNPAATELLACHEAGRGNWEEAHKLAKLAQLKDHSKVFCHYIGYLALTEKFDKLTAFMAQTKMTPAEQQACTLWQIKAVAQAGRLTQADALLADYIKETPSQADAAALAWFTGRMNAETPQLQIRPYSFSDLAVTDPCVLAQAIMAWSLTPNRSMRGASPWDSVVGKIAGGFRDLPEPKSSAVQKAAYELKPY